MIAIVESHGIDTRWGPTSWVPVWRVTQGRFDDHDDATCDAWTWRRLRDALGTRGPEVSPPGWATRRLWVRYRFLGRVCRLRLGAATSRVARSGRLGPAGRAWPRRVRAHATTDHGRCVSQPRPPLIGRIGTTGESFGGGRGRHLVGHPASRVESFVVRRACDAGTHRCSPDRPYRAPRSRWVRRASGIQRVGHQGA